MRILLIEDDIAVADSVTMLLRCEQIATDATTLGADGIEMAKTGRYDLVMLDLGLADMSGFEVLAVLRRSKISTPVIVLSGDAAVSSRVKALRLGADDFVVKPFSRDELTARIRAVSRRSQSHVDSTISIGELVLNLDNKTAEISGVRVDLTVKEYMILEALGTRKGATLSKDAFLHYLYDGRDEPTQKIIDVFVCKLRKKLLKAANGASYIRTVWGQGYTLMDPNAAVAA
ncbi:MAG: response regulator transcription factor [Rhizomicrobium sp.]|jgi:two-component system cell cycle response regulator CtrA